MERTTLWESVYSPWCVAHKAVFNRERRGGGILTPPQEMATLKILQDCAPLMIFTISISRLYFDIEAVNK